MPSRRAGETPATHNFRGTFWKAADRLILPEFALAWAST